MSLMIHKLSTTIRDSRTNISYPRSTFACSSYQVIVNRREDLKLIRNLELQYKSLSMFLFWFMQK